MFTHLLRKDEVTSLHCKPITLLNESDILFFKQLQKILPTRLIFPHLHLSSLVVSKLTHPKMHALADNTLNNFVLNFGVFNTNLELLCAIELEQSEDSGTPSIPASPTAISSKISISQCLKEAKIHHIKWDKNNLPSFEQMTRLLAPFIETNPRILAQQKQEKESTPKETLEEIASDIAISHSEEIEVIEEICYVNISQYDTEKRIEIEKNKSSEELMQESTDSHRSYQHLRKNPVIPIVDLTIAHEHNNPNALSLRFLRDLTPQNFIQKEYPHIWHRICLFAENPSRLNDYLDSLFVQDRSEKRQGLPLHVANEVIQIKIENKHKVQDINDEDIWIGGASASFKR